MGNFEFVKNTNPNAEFTLGREPDDAKSRLKELEQRFKKMNDI